MKPFLSFLRQNALPLSIGLALMLVLVKISQTNYLLFHALAELFSAVIAFSIGLLAWNARGYLQNAYLLIVGTAFAYAGGLNLLHTLAYRGIGVFGDINTDAATQLWLSERFVQAVALCAAPLALRQQGITRRQRIVPMLALGGLSVLLLLAIFEWHIFPVSFVDGVGLTPFKIGAEYVIMALFGIGAGLLWQNRKWLDSSVVRLMLLTAGVNIVTELIFTSYHTVTDVYNLMGHLLKIVSYYLVYKATIETGFLRPQTFLFNEMRDSAARERLRTAQMQAVLNTVPAVVWIAHDAQAQQVTGNRVAAELLRLPEGANPSLTAPEEVAPTHFRVLQNGRELAPEELPLQVSAATGKEIKQFEESIEFGDGQTVRLLGNVSPLLDENGKPAGAVAAFIDITRRVEVERILEETARRYQTLFERMVEGFVLLHLLVDAQGQISDLAIEDFNPAFQAISNLKPDQLRGRTLRQVFPNAHSGWFERLGRVALDGNAVRFEDYSTHMEKYLEITAFRSQPMHCAALITDVTERRNSQEALRLSEARLRRLVDSNIIGIVFTQDDGTVQVANDAFLEMVGYSRQAFENGMLNWVNITPPEHLPLDMRAIAEARSRGACMPYEKEYICLDGTRVPVLIGFAYFGETHPPSYIAFIVDLKERKRAEAGLEQYALQLERSNRELQDFAFVASHDLQEPLRKIQAFGDRLKEQLGERLSEEERDYLQRMLSASGRMRTMVNDLLSLSRITTRGQPFQPVDMNEAVVDVLSDLEVCILTSHAQVRVGDLPSLQADPLQMRQLLLNLIANALKFHRPDQSPVVDVRGELSADGKQVTLEVQDRGIGFEQTYADRIFQPFQRLHGIGQYEGSGIGLAICRKIVERHGGTIRAEGIPEQGAVFIVTLPAVQKNRE